MTTPIEASDDARTTSVQELSPQELREHLIAHRLAGSVATTPSNTIGNCRRLVAGDTKFTFGLSDHRDATLEDAIGAIRVLCGGDPEAAPGTGPGWIDPDQAVAGVALHRERLAAVAARGTAGARPRVLLATGHPTGLLPHYQAISRRLAARGVDLLTPLDDERWYPGEWGARLGMRFLDAVACAYDGASLHHTHLPVYMERMLDELDAPPELVVADHGMAGAAIEAGIPTLSIADVNDPALPLAQVRGRTDAVLCLDDNLAPRVFVAVTAAMLDGI